ncbi:uncharacterized protein LOC128989136 [Macrosteles quadrilineatus]|uniref:uncharacterized protein LOC128989136 n=1 Tax=Macrosteles quadrilineatus TaxID=74068 RepID=UPI0023E0C9B4|nr:uncharacterized protein LOC128989136 [Macrosteles quadrilineatus]
MHQGSIAVLIFLITGVLSAPTDSVDESSKKKIEDAMHSNDIQDSMSPSKIPEDSLTKKNSVQPLETSNEKGDSTILKETALKPVLNDDSSIVKKTNSDVESEIPASKQDGKNDISESVDVHIDNEMLDKLKELTLKAESIKPISQNENKPTTRLETQLHQPAVSRVIGNLIYEVIQAPIFLLRAFKDLVGNMLGIKQSAINATVLTSSTPQ